MGKKWGKRGGGGSKKAPPAKKARRESGGGGGGGGSGRGGGGGGRSHGGYTGHIHGPNVKGRPAIIATCDSIQTKYAAKELLNMLGEYADELYPPVAAVVESAPSAERDGSSSSGNVDGGEDAAPPAAAAAALTVSEMMQLEVKAERKSKKSRRISIVQLGIKGLILLRINDDAINPVRLVRAVFEDLERTGQQKTRFCCRLIPLNCMCKASADEIIAIAKPLIQAHFGGGAASGVKALKLAKKGGKGKGGGGKKFAVHIKRRSNTSVEKMPLIEALAGEVGMDHTVNLSAPDSVVVVEVLKGLAGVAVVDGFTRFKGFNFQTYKTEALDAGFGERREEE